jgi:hypothetical protein
MQALNDSPDEYAKPYAWTMSPITIAEGPLPLNAADIQRAQDVLQFCARERTSLLDQLSLLDWIHDHPAQFEWNDPAERDAIRTAARSTQNDLDIVAQCASAAINNPAAASFPATFATARVPPGNYPSAVLPDPLPRQQRSPAAASILVPKMVGIRSSDWIQTIQCLSRGAPTDEIIAGTYFMDPETRQGFAPVPSLSREALVFLALCITSDSTPAVLSLKHDGPDPYDEHLPRAQVTGQFPAVGTLVPPGAEIILQWTFI